MSPKKLFTFLAIALSAFISREASAQQSVPEKLEADVRFLADTTCTGRGSGTRGYVEASAYVARRLSEIPGAVPGGSGDSSWFASFELPGGRAGHNVIGVLPPTVQSRNPKYILVLSALDGRGTLNGTVYPGADSDASGVAASLGLAARLSAGPVRPCGYIFAFLDGHCSNCAGASALLSSLRARDVPLKVVVNLDIIGSSLSPVVKYYKEYLIALGGAPWSRTMERLNAENRLDLHLYYDYYGSRDFTNLFYRKVGDHKPFLDKGYPCVVFTSGITMLTNKPSDTFETLDYPLMEKRVELICRWLETITATK